MCWNDKRTNTYISSENAFRREKDQKKHLELLRKGGSPHKGVASTMAMSSIDHQKKKYASTEKQKK